jgi:hypothetical protein
VKSFSQSILETPHLITFAGDPTTEFSLTAFLNRFAYKNPKKQHSEKIRRPQATGIYTYAHVYVYVHLYIRIYVCIFIYICMCVYV